MKKIFMTIAVLITIMTSAMVFSSFTIVKEKSTLSNEINSNKPIYWQGTASCGRGGKAVRSITIKVYQSEGMCNAYYAIVDDGNQTECVVRENPDYNPSFSSFNDNHYRYLVSYKGSYYTFNMK